MKRLLLLVFAVLIFSLAAFGQGNTVTLSFPGAPTGSCAFIMFAVRADTGALYDCLSGSWHLISGSGTVTGTGTTGYIPKWSSSTALGNSLCDEGITTANTLTCADTSGMVIASDGVHAGALGLIGNTTVPSLTSNNFHWIGPNSASFTAWGIQMASAENASAGILHVGAVSSHVSQGTVSAIVSADLPGSDVTKTTSTPISVTVAGAGAFYYNQHATAGTAITYNLPTAAAKLTVCVKNSYNGSAANTGVLTVATSASGQFLIDVDGTLGSTGGNIVSGGAGGDGACFVGVDATHWQVYVQKGTWTKS